MANIHLKSSCNGSNINLKSSCNGSNINLGDCMMPKYVGARAVVTRTEDGVNIWMSDYNGTTEETVADGRGISSIVKTSTSGLVDTYTITYTDSTTSTFTVTNGEGGGGSDVSVTQIQHEGTWIATITVDDADTELYAPVETFYAIAGTTSYADVDAAAHDYGKRVVCLYTVNDVTYELPVTAFDDEAHVFAFGCIINYKEWLLTLSQGDGWSINSFDYASGIVTATSEHNGLMAYSDKAKLDGIAAGAEVNVQSDWNQNNSSADDYIKNKPAIPAGAYIAEYGSALYADVLAAYNNGENIVCEYSSGQSTFLYLPLISYSSSLNKFYFGLISDYVESVIELSQSSGWSNIAEYTYDTAASDIFWAEYDETTSDEIEDEFQEGHLVCVYYSGLVYVLTNRFHSSGHMFTANLNNYNYRISCENDVWSYGETSFIATSQKGATGGVCPLNSSGKIDATYLPVYSGGVS